MNIADIKKRVKEEFYIKRDIDFYEAQEDISYLLSIIEHQDNSFKRLQSKAYVGSHDAMLHEINVEIEALQAIRKGD